MNKYGPGAEKIIKQTLSEDKNGTLKIGNSSKTVDSRQQALAIGIDKARRAHKKVPNQPDN